MVYASYRLLPRPEQAPRLRWVQLHSAGADHDLVEPLAAEPLLDLYDPGRGH